MQAVNEFVGRRAAHLDVIALLQMRLGRGNARGPFGVVGQQQQPFAGLIEASDGPEPGRVGRQERVNRVSSLLVRRGRDYTTWLVEHEIDEGSGTHASAVELDAVGVHAHRKFRTAADSAVHAYAAGTDEFELLGTGAVAELGESA